MLRHNRVVFSLLVLLSLDLLRGDLEANGPGANPTNHVGGKAATHRSETGKINSNAQWSADPTRGWVRADERHELKKSKPAPKNHGENGTAKIKGKFNRK